MNWLEFVSSIIGSLAWPGVVLVVLWYNRHRLANLPDWIDELTFPGGAKVKFARAARKAEVAATELLAAKGSTEGQAAPPKQISDLAENHPNAAVVASFEEIQNTLWQMVRFLPLPTKGRDPSSVIHDLVRRGYLESSASTLYRNLAEGRNAAVHRSDDVDWSAGALTSYLAAAATLNEQLNSVLRRLEVENPRAKEWGS